MNTMKRNNALAFEKLNFIVIIYPDKNSDLCEMDFYCISNKSWGMGRNL